MSLHVITPGAEDLVHTTTSNCPCQPRLIRRWVYVHHDATAHPVDEPAAAEPA